MYMFLYVFIPTNFGCIASRSCLRNIIRTLDRNRRHPNSHHYPEKNYFGLSLGKLLIILHNHQQPPTVLPASAYTLPRGFIPLIPTNNAYNREIQTSCSWTRCPRSHTVNKRHVVWSNFSSNITLSVICIQTPRRRIRRGSSSTES